MKIVVFGAGGNIGRRLALEAAMRGIDVTAVVRNPDAFQSPDPRIRVVKGDATEVGSVTRLTRGADVVISALSPRPSPQGPASSLTAAARALIAGVKASGAQRLLIVGGAGSLEVKPGLLNMDQADFPEGHKSEARAQAEALAVYRSEAGLVDWTYVSPAAEIGDGPRTGRYHVGRDQLVVDAQGRSFISFDDYTVAFLDEVERHANARQRITFAY